MPLRRPAVAALVGLALVLLPAGAQAAVEGFVAPRLSCVAPKDAAGIDRVLAADGSPLAGEGATFVAAADAAGLDPRALVAIAAHETLLARYGPSQQIRNPFGLGPGWTFASWAGAITTAADVLHRGYLSEGLITIPLIAAKWAPVGAENDPGGLNVHWTTGVGTYYAALGGDPSRPLLAAAQDAAPTCAPTLWPSGAGPAMISPWGGRAPLTSGPGMTQGGDPRTGLPAVLPGFVFPLALSPGARVSMVDDFAASGDAGAAGCYGNAWRCAVTLQSAPGTGVVAPIAGRLRPASPEERASGVGFWIDGADGDRVGLSALGAYAPGVGAAVEVRAGQGLGATGSRLVVAWTRDGLAINPFPLLAAARPPDG